MMNRFIRLLLSVAIAGCSLPGAYARQGEKKDTISILSFNDFHGAFIPGQGTPGADNFVSTLLDLKGRVPHPVVLSGGDNFSGSYFSLVSGGEPRQVFTLPAAPDTLISAVGNHEFDWKDDYLLDTSCLYINYVAANITANNAERRSTFKEKVPDYRIVRSGDRRVGIIGLSTPTTSTGGKKPYVDCYTFEKEFAAKVNGLAEELKDNGRVDLVVLLMHIGTKMEKNGTPAIDSLDRASEGELRKLSGIDAIVSGHSHKLVRGMFAISGGKQVPMIQAGANGSHIGLLQFEITDSVRCIADSLVQVCVPHPVIRQAVDSIGRAESFNDIYVNVTEELIHDRSKNLHKLTEVGALVTASYKAAYYKTREVAAHTRSVLPQETPVLAVHHFKGIRTGLPKGRLTSVQVGNVLPFGGTLAAYGMTGREVRELFTQGLDSTQQRGLLQTCDMKFEKTDGEITRMEYLNRYGEWMEIRDDTPCIVLCDDFIAFGGDDYPKELFSDRKEDFEDSTTGRFVEYMKDAGSVPNARYRKAEIIYKDSGKAGVESKIEGWKSGGVIEGRAE